MSHQLNRKNTAAAGAGTESRLLETAIDVFGRYGYDAATTRMIAGEAKVNIAAIPYYFSGKEGLYRAVIGHVVDLIATRLETTLEEIAEASFSGQEGKAEAIQLLERLVSKIIIFIVGSPEAPRFSRIILREQMYPTPAYDLIYNGFMARTLEALATLIMVISRDGSERSGKLRAMAVFGQILAFRVARETIVRALDLEGYNDDETEEIHLIVMEHTRSIVRGLVDGSDSVKEVPA